MRIRSIKPDFWRSPDISCLAPVDRLLFIGLWSYVDDNGVGQDRPGVIAADLFADDLSRDPRETLARVSEGVERLSEAGRIVRYTVSGRDYLAIVNWTDHQRIDKPNKPRYPTPTCDDAVIRETLAESSRDSRETLAPGTGEQRSRGTGEQELASLAPASARSRPGVSPIPDDWAPTDTHRFQARSLGIRDLDAAALAFRSHAQSVDRHAASWDAAFASWLAQPRTLKSDRERRATGAPNDDKVHGWLNVLDEPPADHDNPKELPE